MRGCECLLVHIRPILAEFSGEYSQVILYYLLLNTCVGTLTDEFYSYSPGTHTCGTRICEWTYSYDFSVADASAAPG